MTNYIDPKRIAHLMWKPGEDEAVEPPMEENRQERTEIDGNYILMPKTSTYAQGVQALRDACEADPNSSHPQFTRDDGSLIYRPLTFKETIEARVKDYETTHNPDGTERTKDDRLRFFKRWNDSCTGIAYKQGSSKFKVIVQSPKLVTIDKGFNNTHLPINYDETVGVELDRGDATYRNWLTKDQVLNHPAWQAAVEEDTNLLETYRDIVFAERGNPDKSMAFYVLTSVDEDQLRALFVCSLGSNSSASGSGSLSNSGSFLRVAL